MHNVYFLIFTCIITSGVVASYNSNIQSQLQFKSLTIDNGLSNNNVRSICQDSTGYMWFATQNGLNKYDGYTITQYKHDPNDTTSLLSNDIFVLFRDSKNNLWVGTEQG